MQKREPVSPVTFIQDDYLATTDVNGFFIDPYIETTVKTIQSAKIFDDNYKSSVNKDINIELMAQSIDIQNMMAAQKAVEGYIIMNAKSLTKNALIRFAQEAYIPIKHIFNNNFGSYDLWWLANIEEKHINNVISESVKECVRIRTSYQYNDKTLVKMVTDSMMSYIFSNIVTYILAPAVEKSFNSAKSMVCHIPGEDEDSITVLYKAIGTYAYGMEPDKVVSLDTMYTVSISFLNEIMSNVSRDLASAFMLMSDSITDMIFYYPKYFAEEHIMDPNYSINNTIGDNKLFQKVMNGYMKKDDTNERKLNGTRARQIAGPAAKEIFPGAKVIRVNEFRPTKDAI